MSLRKSVNYASAEKVDTEGELEEDVKYSGHNYSEDSERRSFSELCSGLRFAPFILNPCT